MSNNELALSQLEKAVKLNQEILVSADTAQKSIWTMCTKLKEMRDGKLYKELGYQNFEDYCENEVGMKRRNVYNYISIVEKINTENVQPVAQIGVKKLSLLATLSSEQQSDIAEKVDLETTTYKELKAEIDKLKTHNRDLGAAKDKAVAALASLEEKVSTLKEEKNIINNYKNKLEKDLEAKSEMIADTVEREKRVAEKFKEQKLENARLERENEELRSRPVEVAVVDNSAEYEQKLKDALEAAKQENRQHEAELEEKLRAENEAIRKKLEEEKQTAISEVRSDYEKKLSKSKAAEPVDEDKLKFKVYLTSAYDILGRLLEFASQHSEPIYREKIKQLLNNVLTNIEDSQLWGN